MIKLTEALMVSKKKIEIALKQIKKEKQKVKNIYGVIASRISSIHKCDLIIDTEEEILIFGDEIWNEPLYFSWTDDKELYLNEGADILVKQIEYQN